VRIPVPTAVREFFYGLAHARFDREERQRRAELHDLFMLLCYLEATGIPNPAALYVLEFYPVLLDEWHRWHRSLGMDRSPLSNMPCC
jgi:hypothetical protein